jgi:hypothetical protein
VNEIAARALFDEQLKGLTERLLRSRRWTLHQAAYPILDVSFGFDDRPGLRVRMRCDGWNSYPPSIELLHPDGTPFTAIPPNPTGVFNASAHPATGKPFVCMAGSREYHTHSSHLNDHWDNYRTRSSHDLGGLLTQLWNAWRKGG